MQNFDREESAPSALFYEDDIIALQDLDANELYVPLQRLCEKLGLDREEGERVLQSHSVLAVGVQPMAVPGESRLRVDLVPLWLSMLNTATVSRAVRARLELYQRECASVLWHAFKPQGFGPEDTLVPPRFEMSPADQAYQSAMAQAALARQQMLIERQLQASQVDGNRIPATEPSEPASTAHELARMVRRVAHTLAARSRRNEYGGVFSGLYRQFGISSYRNLPRGRLHEALQWLERWHSDMLGEPEPPPDI